jgi:putative membrane protein
VSSLPAAIVLDLGGLYVLYLTGLYRAAENDDLIHAAVHLHMFLAGCLLSWALIGLDPIRRRPGIKARLAALVVAGAAHDTLAKLMYSHSLPVGGGSLASRHTGAELMYYGGTVIDIALAIVLMAQWYQASGRALARTARRGNAGAHAHLIADRQTRNRGQTK